MYIWCTDKDNIYYSDKYFDKNTLACYQRDMFTYIESNLCNSEPALILHQNKYGYSTVWHNVPSKEL